MRLNHRLLRISSLSTYQHQLRRPLPAYLTFTQRAAMSSTSNNTPGSSNTTTNPQQPQDTKTATAAHQDATAPPLPLPEPDTSTTQLPLGGEGVKLDHLGPLVVNEDGTMSRIANWTQMADIERENAVRILGKRNKIRLERLRARQGQREEK
ncbi:hypothetical protein F5B20DRAFT_203756 [Whalleya microplaca]|nr:hypothetical protein F5B20DRAFT_203756 [Whalleya microplaca]